MINPSKQRLQNKSLFAGLTTVTQKELKELNFTEEALKTHESGIPTGWLRVTLSELHSRSGLQCFWTLSIVWYSKKHNTRRRTRSKNSVILSVIHHRQNPLESTYMHDILSIQAACSRHTRIFMTTHIHAYI
jgi:hypothetical protein